MHIRTWGAVAALTLIVPVGLAAPAHAAPAHAAATAKPFDLNGDGYPELVVGAPYLQVGSVKNAGGVFVLPGSKSGLSLKEKVVTQSSRYILGASESDDAFGYAVASADFDRDGFADLAVGQPGEDDGSGAVTVVYGSKTGLNMQRNVRITFPETSGLGTALVAADLTGDGYADLAAGSPGEDQGEIPEEDYAPSGVVHILPGSETGLTTAGAVVLRRQGGTGRTGFDLGFGSLLAAGDLNTDGRTDLVVGSDGDRFVDDGYPGSVSVCLGKTGGPSGCTQVAQDADFGNMSALAVGNLVGSSTSAPEIVVGTAVNYEDDPGRVSILRLGAGATTVAERTDLDEDSPGVPGKAGFSGAFGASLATGDIDRDGHDDVVVGAPYDNDYRGRVIVIRGGTDGYATSGNYAYDQATKGVPGSSEREDHFGGAVTLVDHDRDGRLDLSVGAPGENTGDGAVTFLKGSGTRFTTKGAKGFSPKSLGYAHQDDGSFGEALGVPAR